MLVVQRFESRLLRDRGASATGDWLRVQHGCVVELLEGVHEQLPVAADLGAVVKRSVIWSNG